MMKYSIVVIFIALGAISYAKDPIPIKIQRVNDFVHPPPETKESRDITEQWFDQILDHNTPNSSSWNQRYYELKDYYKPGGPVFIFLSGVGPATNAWMTTGLWIDNAKLYNAHCFQLEHRFYGLSRPTKNVSVENLQYLTSEQAIADAAYFIKQKNLESNFPEGTKWVAFGGFYAGNLVAWLRLKYPDLVHIGVASSAPVLAKLDFYEYYEVVAESLKSHNAACLAPLKEANEEVEKLLNSKEGINTIASLFYVCNGESLLQDINNQKSLVFILHSLFGSAVQYNNDANSFNINTVCDYMLNTTLETPLERLAALIVDWYSLSESICLNVNYQESIEELKSEQWHYARRQWLFQTCNEFGYYDTSSQNVNKVWGNTLSLEYYIQQCQDIFGSSFNKAFVDGQIAKTNAYYKGLDMDVSHLVHIHGSIDPWHALGIINSTKAHMPSIYIKGSSHCADMTSSGKFDSEELRNAKIKITELIGQWLQE